MKKRIYIGGFRNPRFMSLTLLFALSFIDNDSTFDQPLSAHFVKYLFMRPGTSPFFTSYQPHLSFRGNFSVQWFVCVCSRLLTMFQRLLTPSPLILKNTYLSQGHGSPTSLPICPLGVLFQPKRLFFGCIYVCILPTYIQ